MFKIQLNVLVNINHELCQLATEIDWRGLEKGLSIYYSEHGRPSVPIRTIAGMLMLKSMFNESDESVIARWIENPYWQYFTGEQYFQTSQPFDPSDFVHFRKRIGQRGLEEMFSYTVKIHQGACQEKEVQIDSTVQPKNISFPTDSKLAKKVIEKCLRISHQEETKLRQSYKREVKQLMKDQYNSKHPRRAKKGRKARKRLKTIAGRLIRELRRELSKEKAAEYEIELNMFEKVLAQKRGDKNKIYSLHEPHTSCIAKGKAHKQYEFGSKVTIVRGSKTGVILGALSVEGNPHDSKILDPMIEQCERILSNIPKSKMPQIAVTDRGYRGKKEVRGVTIYIPNRSKKKMSKYEKQKERKRFRARAGIEPVIGHIKHDHRMIRNYLKGIIGDVANALLASMGFNLKKKLNQIAFYDYFKYWVQTILYQSRFFQSNLIFYKIPK